jgi:hypothetical protein
MDNPILFSTNKKQFDFIDSFSIIYDHDIDPGHWTKDMQEYLFELVDLYKKDLIVLEVRGVHIHGLIMGCSVTCVKRVSVDYSFNLEPKVENHGQI